MTLLLFRVIDQRQIRAQARSEFSCFDQHRLQMLVPLFRDGHALDRLRRASLSTAQTAVTHSLLDRVKANYIVDFKHPGQRGDRPDRRIVIRRSTRACSSGSRRNERTSALSTLGRFAVPILPRNPNPIPMSALACRRQLKTNKSRKSSRDILYSLRSACMDRVILFVLHRLAGRYGKEFPPMIQYAGYVMRAVESLSNQQGVCAAKYHLLSVFVKAAR
jgi:hypothetical protein